MCSYEDNIVHLNNEELQRDGNQDNDRLTMEQQLDDEMQSMRNNLWVDSLLLNYTEEVNFNIPDPRNPGKDKSIMRRVSIGLTVKSDNRARAAILHHAASKSLNYLIEIEKEKFMNEEKMKIELDNTQTSLEEKVEEIIIKNEEQQSDESKED